jgi:hypothetical protein
MPGPDPHDAKDHAEGSPPAKRKYVPPKLERLGTIRELTRGEGQNNNFDGLHPPGQNKSRL